MKISAASNDANKYLLHGMDRVATDGTGRIAATGYHAAADSILLAFPTGLLPFLPLPILKHLASRPSRLQKHPCNPRTITCYLYAPALANRRLFSASRSTTAPPVTACAFNPKTAWLVFC